MRHVTKEEFREMYMRGATGRDGWTQEYWDHFFEPPSKREMRYAIEEPPSPAHNRMMIVSDFAVNEYRLFFMTEEAEDSR